jgi:hypothetical protein
MAIVETRLAHATLPGAHSCPPKAEHPPSRTKWQLMRWRNLLMRCTNRNESEVERVCQMAPRKARPGDRLRRNPSLFSSGSGGLS